MLHCNFFTRRLSDWWFSQFRVCVVLFIFAGFPLTIYDLAGHKVEVVVLYYIASHIALTGAADVG
jgi:hypothetical protein